MIEKIDFSLLKRKLTPLLETGLTYKKKLQLYNGQMVTSMRNLKRGICYQIVYDFLHSDAIL